MPMLLDECYHHHRQDLDNPIEETSFEETDQILQTSWMK